MEKQSEPTKTPTLVAVASGKGGVGKTTISVNLSKALLRNGKKVALIDGDLGLANAQIILGVNAPFHMGDILAEKKQIAEVVVETADGLILVPGASGNSEIANITSLQTQALIQGLVTEFSDIDYIVVDSAAGLSSSNLTFFRACDLRMVVIEDEPASIADAYGLIKLQSIENRMEDLYILPNRVRNQNLGETLFEKLNRVCMKFLEQPVGYLLSIEEDQCLVQTSRKRGNLFELFPNSPAARSFSLLADKLAKPTISNS